MQMPLKLFPDDIINHYNLSEKALNGYVYMEIWCGMYGLPQAGIFIRSAKQDDNYGASNIVLPCPSS